MEPLSQTHVLFPPEEHGSDGPARVAVHCLDPKVEALLRLADFMRGRRHQSPEESCHETALEYALLGNEELSRHWLAVEREIKRRGQKSAAPDTLASWAAYYLAQQSVRMR